MKPSRALVIPVGEGSYEGTITFLGDEGTVLRALEASKKSVYEMARSDYQSLPEKEKAVRKPCGCNEK